LTAGAGVAQTVDRATCLNQAEAGQLARKAGRVAEARKAFAVCAVEGCPKLVRSDCQQWLGEIVSLMPTVTVLAKGPGSKPIEASVRVDGVVVSSNSPIQVDPGIHTIEVSATGFTDRKQVVDAAVGARISLEVVLESIAAFAPSTSEPVGTRQRTWVPSVGLGAAAVLAAVAGGILGWQTLSGFQRARQTCAGACDPLDVRQLRTTGVWADVLLIGAAVLGSGSVLVWFFQPAPSIHN
jgi:hypothetical protein